MIPDEDLTLTKISSDLMHQSSLLAWHGQSGYGGGDVVDIVVGSIPCEVSLSLSYPRSHIEETPCSLDNLLVEEMFMNEGSYPATLEGQVDSEYSAATRPV